MEQSEDQIQTRLLNQINSSFDFKRLFGAILTNWYWFVLCVSITMTAGFLYLRYTTKIYTVYSSILLEESSQNSAAQSILSKIDPDNDNSRVNLFNEKVILQSQDLIHKVVDSLDLNIRYWTMGRVKETELYDECPIRIVFDDEGFTGDRKTITVRQIVEGQFEIVRGENSERVLYGTWITRSWGRFKILYVDRPGVNRGFLEESTDFKVQINHIENTISSVGNKFEVSLEDGRTSLLDLFYSDNIRSRGVDFMSTVIYFYQKNELKSVRETAKLTKEFIEGRKSKIYEELQEIDSLTVDIHETNEVVDVKSETSALFSEKNEQERNIELALYQKKSLNQLVEALENPTNGRFEIIAGIDVRETNLLQLIQEYNIAVGKRATLARNWGPSHPQLQDLESEMAGIRKRILDATKITIRNVNRDLAALREKRNQAAQRISKTPEINKEIKDVNRNYPVLQNIYLLLYQKLVENEISMYSAQGKSKVVVEPYAYGVPKSPVPKRIYMIMFLLGMLLPGGIIVLREVLNNKVINDNDIESKTSIPIIGSIGRVEGGNEGANIVVGPHVRTGVAEQFRLIRANMEFMTASKDNRTYMITSSTSGEGKSFISVNLGITMTLAKKRVIVLEFDLRKPKISHYLGLSNDGGISGYLAGLCGLENVIKASGIHENLYVANSGPIPPNPGELLVSEKNAQLFAELKEMFDVIIIDTAPIGMVSDALILSQFAGINLFVIRQQYTVKDQVRMFDVLHKDGKIQNPAIIFNGVEFLKKYGYGYGGSSGYGYGYVYGYQSGGYGYYEENTKKKKRKKGFLKRFFTK